MRRGLRAALARLVDARRRGTSLALLFDYDGTLVPIVEHPSMAVLSTETRYRLEQLALTPSIFVGVLSGRAIDDLRDRVGVEGAYYVGTSGLELSFGSMAIAQPERARAVPLVAAVVRPIRRAIAGYAGAVAGTKAAGPDGALSGCGAEPNRGASDGCGRCHQTLFRHAASGRWRPWPSRSRRISVGRRARRCA